MSAELRSRGASTVGETITTERVLGTEQRWRRFGEPILAGASLKEDGTPDYGIFGPGSVVWEVLLHPATVFFHNIGQAYFQSTYKPIEAGIRDHEPMSRKARQGTLTFFDSFERASRNAGMHAPMWLGDTKTAEAMAAHLKRIHQKVTGDVIDRGEPGLGGYAAASPRESLWAALTEMHPMLWVYEAFAFRNWWLPRRLSRDKRDRFIAEVAAYCRLHGAPEEEIPTSMAELQALYKKYDAFFRHSDTVVQYLDTGEVFWDVVGKSMVKNFNWSMRRPVAIIFIQYIFFKPALFGAISAKARHNRGNGPIVDLLSVVAKFLYMPLIWVMQQPPLERYFMRRMWGPDGVRLIQSARVLHRKALQQKAATK